MEPKVRYMGGVISESSAIDQISQNLSAFKIIDQITTGFKSTDPLKSARDIERIAIPINFQVISLWKRSNLKDLGKDISARMEVEIVDAKGEVLQTIPFELQLPATKLRSRYILTVQGMPVTITGEYCFQFREIGADAKKTDPLAKLCFDIIVNRE